MKKLVISMLVLLVGSASFWFFSQPIDNDIRGEVTIIVINELEEVVYQQSISFEEEDTLFELLDRELNVQCANMSYQISDACVNVTMNGKVILGLDDVKTDWYHSFIAIYVDGEYSEYGIDGIALKDGSTYRFEYTEVGGASE